MITEIASGTAQVLRESVDGVLSFLRVERMVSKLSRTNIADGENAAGVGACKARGL